MSVSTEADNHRDGAIDGVKDAIRHLSEIVVNQCHGHDDYSDAYQDVLRRSLADLIEVRDRL